MDAVIDALVAGDAGRVLVAVADALASGRDPRSLGEGVIAALRDAFLAGWGRGTGIWPLQCGALPRPLARRSARRG